MRAASIARRVRPSKLLVEMRMAVPEHRVGELRLGIVGVHACEKRYTESDTDPDTEPVGRGVHRRSSHWRAKVRAQDGKQKVMRGKESENSPDQLEMSEENRS